MPGPPVPLILLDLFLDDAHDAIGGFAGGVDHHHETDQTALVVHQIAGPGPDAPEMPGFVVLTSGFSEQLVIRRKTIQDGHHFARGYAIAP